MLTKILISLAFGPPLAVCLVVLLFGDVLIARIDRKNGAQ